MKQTSKTDKQEQEEKIKTETNKIDIEKLPMLNVGMFGHIDHGKTTLLQRLTGKFADTHSEELKRGITIKLGYADAVIYNCEEHGYSRGCCEKAQALRYVSFVDAPGHEMLMATMLSGAAIIDAAILVIAANEGIKPQTREHLIALQAKNIKNIIIIQNKIDLIERHEALRNYQQIKESVKGTIAENAKIIPVSAQQNVNVEKILEELCKIEIPARDLKSEPLFIIARSFDINKPGTKIPDLKGGVLGGILKKGILKVGQEIEIKPGINYKKENQVVYETIKTKIVSFHKGNYKIQEATPSGSLAIETELDPNLTKADSLAGCIVGISQKLPETAIKIKVKFSLFEKVLGMKEEMKVEMLKTNELILLSINTSITIGNVVKVKNDEAELNLRIPIVPFKGENIGLARNINGHWRLIGFGEIV